MPSEDDTFTVDDLVEAMLEQEIYRQSDLDLVDYYSRRLEVLCDLFQVNLETRLKELDESAAQKRRATKARRHDPYEVSGSQTRWFIKRCVGIAIRQKNPFDYSGLLIGIPPRFERQLAACYADECKTISDRMDAICRALLRQTLVHLFPHLAERTVEAAELVARGVPLKPPGLFDALD